MHLPIAWENKQFAYCGGDGILKSLASLLSASLIGTSQAQKTDNIVLVNNITPSRLWNNKIWTARKNNCLPVFCVERASLPNMVSIDNNGFLASSSSYNENHWNHDLTIKEIGLVKDYIEHVKNEKFTMEKQESERMTQSIFQSEYKLDNFNQVVFVPLQKPTDTVITHYAGWINSVANFVDLITCLSQKFTKTLFLVKPHPCREFEFNETSNIKNAKYIHYKDCIDFANKVFVINSGVGLQAMLWQKPTYILGESHYNFNEINYKINSMQDAVEAMKQHVDINMDKVYRFIYYLKFVLWSDCDLTLGPKGCIFHTIRIPLM